MFKFKMLGWPRLCLWAFYFSKLWLTNEKRFVNRSPCILCPVPESPLPRTMSEQPTVLIWRASKWESWQLSPAECADSLDIWNQQRWLVGCKGDVTFLRIRTDLKGKERCKTYSALWSDHVAFRTGCSTQFTSLCWHLRKYNTIYQ